MLEKWEEGYKVVQAVKSSAQESGLMFGVRKLYYRLVSDISEVQLVQNTTGYGLYDKQVIAILQDDRRFVPLLPRHDRRARL